MIHSKNNFIFCKCLQSCHGGDLAKFQESNPQFKKTRPKFKRCQGGGLLIGTHSVVCPSTPSKAVANIQSAHLGRSFLVSPANPACSCSRHLSRLLQACLLPSHEEWHPIVNERCCLVGHLSRDLLGPGGQVRDTQSTDQSTHLSSLFCVPCQSRACSCSRQVSRLLQARLPPSHKEWCPIIKEHCCLIGCLLQIIACSLPMWSPPDLNQRSTNVVTTRLE